MTRIAKPACLAFMVVFLLLAGLGFIENPLIGPHAMLETNTRLNIAYFCFALLLCFGATRGESRAAMSLYYVAGLCGLLAFAGFWQANGAGRATIYTAFNVNQATSILHAALSVLVALPGLKNTASQQLIRE